MEVNSDRSHLRQFTQISTLLLVVLGLLSFVTDATAGGFCHKSRAVLLVPATESRVVERVVEEPVERVVRRRVIRREVIEVEPEPETDDRDATPSPQAPRAATPPAKTLPRSSPQSVITRDVEPERRQVVREYVREVPVRREVVREYVREAPAEREVVDEEPEVETRYVRVREVAPTRVRVVRAAPVEERAIVVREVRAAEPVLVKKHCFLFGK